MKLTKKQENEILHTHEAYWTGYINGDVKGIASLLDDHYTQVGSAETEVFFNKKAAVKFLHDTIDQVVGKLDMRNRTTRLEQLDDLVMVHELCDLYARAGKKWIWYSKFRASTLMQHKKNSWKIIHQHSSMPDTRTGEGENVAIHKVEKENQQLREAVKRRTVELEHKSRELKIEAALERVRSVAMGMHTPEDLLNVCETLYKEFNALGFEGLRNAMINIHEDEKRTFVNYDFSETIGKSINPLTYGIHPVIAKQIKQIRKAKDAFSKTVFKGKDLASWKNFRKKVGEKDDPRIRKTKALYYYFYSIGTGSIGISTFTQINDEKLQLLKQFRNVFNLAYQRYQDIVFAKAQAREAQIETSLERVRSRSMAMHSSNELKDVITVVMEQFKHLGFKIDLANFNFLSASKDWSMWLASSEQTYPEVIHVPYKKHPLFDRPIDSFRKGNDFMSDILTKSEVKSAMHHFYKTTPLGKYDSKKRKLYVARSKGLARSILFLKNISLTISNFDAIPYTDEQNSILRRLAHVFKQSYTRFQDLQKAEAQAKEAQIEAALERLRARSMAMHQSGELNEIVAVVYEQLSQLGFDSSSYLLRTREDSKEAFNTWLSFKEISTLPKGYYLPKLNNPIHKRILKAWDDQEEYKVIEFGGDEKRKYDNLLFTKTSWKEFPQKAKKAIRSMDYAVICFSSFRHIGLQAIGIEPLPDDKAEILVRFAKVFEQTYTRFLDLQKAETQARETEIQLALERVRARTMAMHKSDELAEVVAILYEQIQNLGFTDWGCSIIICDQEAQVMRYWYAEINLTHLPDYCNVPLTNKTVKKTWKLWQSGIPQFDISLLGIAKEDYTFFMLNDTDYHHMLPKEVKEEWIKPKDIFFSYFTFKYGLLEFVNIKPLDKANYPTYQRLAQVFEQTYTRFLDLQKAEAQVREAQIENALEKVRSSSLAMHKSDEIKAIVKVVFEQLKGLNFAIDGAAFIGIPDTTNNTFNIWVGDDHTEYPSCFRLPFHPAAPIADVWQAYQDGSDFLTKIYSKKEKNKWFRFAFVHTDFKTLPIELKEWILNQQFLTQTFAMAKYSGVGIHFHHHRELSSTEIDILKRFSHVFEQGYIRFLDLQKAEAQAREAAIELGLERVRARAMAMHHSDELAELVATVFHELNQLDFSLASCIIWIHKPSDKSNALWIASEEMNKPARPLQIVPFYPPFFTSIIEAWKIKDPKWIFSLTELEKKNFEKLFFKQYPELPDGLKKPISKNKQITFSASFNNFGALEVVATEPLTDEKFDILHRFGKVFNSSYTRFHDLQKAEAQAMEAQIEASLERVRARSMAMHQSDELSECAELLFSELSKLGGSLWSSGFAILKDDDQGDSEYRTTDQFGSREEVTFIPNSWDPTMRYLYEGWKQNDKYRSYDLGGEEIKQHYANMLALPRSGQVFQVVLDTGSTFPVWQQMHAAYFKQGYLLVISLDNYKESELLVRFARVFEQTYTRFLDLQKAEAQAREAQIEASLERIRAKAMGMHHSVELSDVLVVLFQQFDVLNIHPTFTNINLFDVDSNKFTHVTTGKGGIRVIAQQTVALDAMAVWQDMMKDWIENNRAQVVKEVHYPVELLPKVFEIFHEIRMAIPEEGRAQVEDFPNGMFHTLSYCLFGNIGFAHTRKATEEEKNILSRFAREFERLYQRFLDLQKAEAQTREAQIDVAVERVRARALAMHKSEEIISVAKTLRTELDHLKIPGVVSTTIYLRQEDGRIRFWDITTLEESDDAALTLDQLLRLEDCPPDLWFQKIWRSTDKYFMVEQDEHDLEISMQWIKENVSEEVAVSMMEFLKANNLNHLWHPTVQLTEGRMNIDFIQPPPAETESILMKMGAAFDLAHKRFLDLQKAETQAREAQIEVAVERVRAKALAMHQSTEIGAVANTLKNELSGLNIPGVAAVTICLQQEDGNIRLWDITSVVEREDGFHFSMDFMFTLEGTLSDDWIRKIWDGTERYYVVEQDWPDMERTIAWTRKYNPAFADNAHQFLENNNINYVWHPVVQLSHGKLSLDLFQKPVTEVESILTKMGAAFDLAYKRFLDLQNAEAQTREAKIQLSLERVRSRAMAMHHTDELSDVLSVLFEQFDVLGISPMYTFLSLIDIEKNSFLYRQTGRGGKRVIAEQVIDLNAMDVWQDAVVRWKAANYDVVETMFVPKELVPEVFEIYKPIYSSLPEGAKVFPEDFPDGIHATIAASRFGHLGYDHFRASTEEEKSILLRFNTEFVRLYQRFLDLQKAEAQARESQIQLALERVRARTMAMHHSNELADTATILFQQIKELGFEIWSCGFGIWKPEIDLEEAWMSTGDLFPIILIPFKDDPTHLSIYEASQREESVFEVEVKGEVLTRHYDWLMSQPSFKIVFGQIENSGIILPPVQWKYAAFFKQGYLHLITTKPQPDIHDINRRFAKVFEQTYTRFLDLQKAEAQAREAQIEAALERVRSKAMAMHTSDDIMQVVLVLREQMELLGKENLESSNIHLYYDENQDFDVWWSNKPLDVKERGMITGMTRVPLTTRWAREAVKKYFTNQSTYEIIAAGETLQEWYEYMNVAIPEIMVKDEKGQLIIPEKLHYHFARFSGGSLLMITEDKPTSVAIDLQKRAAGVFGLAYQRFLDLQKAEAQARESQIQLALERVRARTMAMQRSEELPEVAALLFQQVKTLGVPQFHCGFNIFEIDDKECTWYPGSADGDILPPCKIPLTEHPVFMNFIESRKRGDELCVYEKEGEYQAGHYRYMLSLPVLGEILQNMLDAGIPFPTFQIDHLANFSHGNLLFITSEHFPEMHDTFKRFAKVFEQTYTRFLDLQKAEAQAREAQIEAALERVRSKTMAMHNSNDVGETVATMFDELTHLGAKTYRSGIIVVSGDFIMDVWTAHQDRSVVIGKLDMKIHPMLINIFNAWTHHEKSYQYHLVGDDLIRYFTAINNSPNYPIRYELENLPKDQFNNIFFFNEGALFAFTQDEVSSDYQNIFRRFADVFGQTYTRYKDLQKAEAQAREAQIQLALERVRARTMAMQRSEELAEVSYLLNKQVVELGIPTRGCAFNIYNEHDSTEWFSNLEGTLPTYKTPRENIFLKYYEAGQRGETLWIEEFGGDRIKEHYKYLFSVNIMAIGDELAHKINESIPDFQIDHVAYFKYGYLLFITLIPAPEAHDVFKRFAKEFEQTYTRFLDLQKAEAQAREAQIEAALERIRSSAMAMHSSEGILEVTQVLREQIAMLGEKELESILVHIYHEDTDQFEAWYSYRHPENTEKQIRSGKQKLSWSQTARARKDKEKYHQDSSDYSIVADYKMLKEWYEYLFETIPEVVELDANGKPLVPDVLYYNYSKIAGGTLLLITNSEASDHSKYLLRRAAIVFNLAYSRFLDLQKAEAQAREAQIEAALEKVRARSLGMHKSEELEEVILVVSEQLQQLQFRFHNVSFGFNAEQMGLNFWLAAPGMPRPLLLIVPYLDNPAFNKPMQARNNGVDFSADMLTHEENLQFLQHLFDHSELGDIPVESKNFLLGTPGFARSQSLMKNTILTVGNYALIPYSEEQNAILKRFGNVFEQAYTRFLDLQKAEVQAREAQIEAALERVRGKAMAMHSTEDLTATISAFYHELELFSITPRRCGVGLLDKETHMAELSTMNTTEQGKSIEIIGRLKMTGHPVLEGVFDNWLLQNEYHPVLRGNEIKEYYQLIRQHVAFPEYPSDAVQYGYFFYFPEGGVYAWTENEMTEDELKIYRRFTSVLSLTYKRYKDLKDAEARAKEAVKQAALDRVRADIASMRNASDLDRITPLIWKELTTLGIPFIRCGVFIMDLNENRVHTYLSTPGGEAIAAYHIPIDDTGSLAPAVNNWRQQKAYVAHWDESDFQIQADVLLKQGAISSPEQYLSTIPKGGFHLQFLPFGQGMLYVGSNALLQNDELQLVQSLADAFSVAYARYEDFRHLEDAKNRIESTLSELKSTQSQLIQSEKMASLGEMTAGIAHEIQNPLNFVNNFSEVSKELLDEMKTELAKGNTEEASVLAADVIQNLEKINHHGKRADGIVKSMLQHSRKSTGQKELTDINALCDEYLRLSYHGLRAKDKSFNAKFQIDLDPNVPKINVLPQDIGRVILNLINNAFYAVSERQKAESTNQGSAYEPTVIVSTRNNHDKIELAVKDNGTGIPQKVLDKIFQPFFTTKPTGQGTGLGLSLSYDIVKAHGGEIKVKTVENEGTEFTILLSV